jgi:hypothetical protein
MCIGGRWLSKGSLHRDSTQCGLGEDARIFVCAGNVLGHAGATIYNLFFVDTSSFRLLPRLPNPEGKDPS